MVMLKNNLDFIPVALSLEAESCDLKILAPGAVAHDVSRDIRAVSVRILKILTSVNRKI